MNKKLLLVFAALFSCSAAFAQTESSLWRFYDSKNKKERIVEIPHSKILPMNIIGPDDRQEITGKANGFEQAAVVLEIHKINDKYMYNSQCSGVMVAPNIVLTAAHCLTGEDTWLESVRVIAAGLPQKSDDAKSDQTKKKLTFAMTGKTEPAKPEETPSTTGDTTFPSANMVKTMIPYQWEPYGGIYADELHDSAANYDYGLIILDSNLGFKTGWLDIATTYDEEDLLHKDIILLGRGHDKPKRTLWRAEGRIERIDFPFIYHNADSLGGNSGGPILLKDDPHTILALYTFSQSDNHEEYSKYPNGGLCIPESVSFAINWNIFRKHD